LSQCCFIPLIKIFFSYIIFLKYFFKGWIRPDLFPFDFKGKNEWEDFFKSISYKEFSERKIAVNGMALGSVQTEMFSKAFPGMKASADVRQMAAHIAEFAIGGAAFYNGKNLQVSNSTP